MERNIAKTAAKGDRLTTLEALRDRIAAEIDVTVDGRDLAALALRLQRVLSDIAELGGRTNEETDDLAARRDAKLHAASGS